MTEKEFDKLGDGFYWAKDQFRKDWEPVKVERGSIGWLESEIDTYKNEVEENGVEFGGPCTGKPDISDIVSVTITKESFEGGDREEHEDHYEELQYRLQNCIEEFLKERKLESNWLNPQSESN